MEGVHGTHKASKLVSEDVFSSMPDNVMTNILDRLPIQDALRTSILARNWRLKWTLLTQLKFDMIISGLATEDKEYSYTKIVSRVLLNLKGPVRKLALHIADDKNFDFDDLNHWVLFLSRKGIKDFTIFFNIFNIHNIPLKLPTQLFSCLELTHLTLLKYVFHPPPTFHGFPNLLSLDLFMVRFESIGYGEFITQCPLLEILEARTHGDVKLVEIAKLENLKILSLSLCKLDIQPITSSIIFQLGGYLPKLQELDLDCQDCKFIGETIDKKWLRTAFPRLKTLALYSMDFSSNTMLSLAFELILGSPNLQTLKIIALYKDDTPPPAFCFIDEDNNAMELLQLRNVCFLWCRGSENELCLIKYVLACSPLLKKIDLPIILSQVFGGDKGKLMFVSKLLELPRASPITQVKLREF